MTRIALALLLTACSGGAASTTADPPKDAPAKTDKADGHGHDHGDAHGHDHDHDGKAHAHEHDHAKGDDHDHGHDAAKTMKPTAGAKVMFMAPKDGDKVKSPVKVVMGLEGMTIQPAGELKEGTGHHHLVIDSEAVPFGVAVPADETHIHFGKGQTEAEVELKPGEHTLMLQLADGVHRSYGEQMSATIKITVE